MAASVGAWAQQGKTLTIYIGYPAGGSPDLVARTIAPRLSGQLKQNIVIENRPGAGGALAMDSLKKAPKDGTALALTPSPPLTLNPFVYPKLSYDAFEDFAPVGRVVTFDLALAVPASHPAKSMREFIEWARKNPDAALFGVPGLGSTPHFLGYLIGRAAGFDYRVVAYKGGPQLMSDLIGAQIPSAISVLSNFVQDHRSGRLRVLATSGSDRSTLLPEVPTLAQTFDAPAVREATTVIEWYGLMAPAGTPVESRERIHAAVVEVLKDKTISDTLTAQGHDPAPMPGPAFGEFIRKQQERWGSVVKESGFKLES